MAGVNNEDNREQISTEEKKKFKIKLHTIATPGIILPRVHDVYSPKREKWAKWESKIYIKQRNKGSIW